MNESFESENCKKIFDLLSINSGLTLDKIANILDLEIRYKGEFRSQPQWQGTLNYDFINFLKVECDL